MKVVRFFLLAVFLVPALLASSAAQDDPSAAFFSAYQEFQRAERLEREGRNDDAIAKFRFVAAQLSQIKSENPDWQPLVVDFRLRRTQEAVLRLEGSLASPTLGPPPDLIMVDDDDLPPIMPPRRATPAAPAAGPTISISPFVDTGSGPAPAAPSRGTASSADLEQLQMQLAMEQERSAELQKQVERGEVEFSSVSTELDKTKVMVVDLTTQLRNFQEGGAPGPVSGASEEELSRLAGVAAELESTLAAAGEERQQLSERVAESTRQIEELTAQLAEAQSGVDAAQAAAEAAREEAEVARARAGELESEREAIVAERDSAREEVETARGEVQTLTVRVTELEDERASLIAARDTAQQEAAEAKSALEKSADLIEANRQLEEKLVAAADQISGMETDVAAKADVIAGLQADLETVREELVGAQAKLREDRERFDQLQAVNEQLLREYDEVTGAMAAVRLGEMTAAEAKLLQQENEVLRSIIMRQILEQARREQAFRLAQEEMDRLEIRSDTLSEKISELALPTLQLTAAEQEMLKRPVITLVEEEGGRISGQIEVVKPQTDDVLAQSVVDDPVVAMVEIETGEVVETADDSVAVETTVEEAPTGSAAGTGELPAEVLALVDTARDEFVAGNFARAEELYQQFVELQPDNVVALANLGVAQFRQGKLTAAQLALERAIKANPVDAFSLTTLGAVMIEQNRIEEAVGYLERADEVAVDDPITLNYLGVATSQLGQFGRAEQSLRRAINVNPDYAEAHFNLAVIYATAKPPSIALAKRHYERALELGADADPRLATMLQSEVDS